MSIKEIETSDIKIEDKTVKQLVQTMLDNLPDDITWRQFDYHLGVVKTVSEALRKAETDPGIPQEEAEKVIDSWFE